MLFNRRQQVTRSLSVCDFFSTLRISFNLDSTVFTPIWHIILSLVACIKGSIKFHPLEKFLVVMVSANLMFFVVPYVFLKLQVIDALFKLDEISYSFSEVITDFSFLLLIFVAENFSFKERLLTFPSLLILSNVLKAIKKHLARLSKRLIFVCLTRFIDNVQLQNFFTE